MNKFRVPCIAPALALACLVATAAGWPGPDLRAGYKPTQERIRPLYPLKKGLKWETLNYGENRGTREVTEIVPLKKLSCYKLVSNEYRIRYRYTLVNHDYLCVMDDGGVYKVGEKRGNDDIVTYDPPLRILKPASRETQRWDYDYQEWKSNGEKVIDERRRGSAVQCYETINYGGENVEAVRVTFETRTWKSDTWYVPGKGPIKHQQRHRESGDGGPFRLSIDVVVTSFSGADSFTFSDYVVNSTAALKGAVEKPREAAKDSKPGVASVKERIAATKKEILDLRESIRSAEGQDERNRAENDRVVEMRKKSIEEREAKVNRLLADGKYAQAAVMQSIIEADRRDMYKGLKPTDTADRFRRQLLDAEKRLVDLENEK
jgi:hypothetical protein